MPQPAENARVAQELADLYRTTQDRLAAELTAVVNDPSRRSQVSRLRAMIRTVGAYRAELEDATRSWLQTAIPEVHARGAVKAAADVGSDFAWTAPHVESVQALAESTWSDVAANLRDMETETRTALRSLAKESGRQVILEGQSSLKAARGIETWMGENGIGTVTYKNGAKHLAADYADMLARTSAATAYNEGAFVQLEQDDIEWVEVSDGPACGWTSHRDGDKANGTVRHLSDAREHPLSHPRCARSFSGRPDITSAKEAQGARQFTPEQQAQMAAEENARAAAAPSTLTGRRRTTAAAKERTPRQPREQRTARAPRSSGGDQLTTVQIAADPGGGAPRRRIP